MRGDGLGRRIGENIFSRNDCYAPKICYNVPVFLSRKMEERSVKSEKQIQSLPIASLLLDARNPRFVNYLPAGKSASQRDLLQVARDHGVLDELASSIAAGGFYPHEPLIAEPRGDGKYVVIDGNRRLAAAQLLLSRDLRERLKSTDFPALKNEKARVALRQIPVWTASRDEAWRTIVFKHVNGPLRWGTSQKVKHVVELRRNCGVSLGDISECIGDRHGLVAKLHRTLMVVEQAEREGVFQRKDRWRPHFSLLFVYDGIQYSAIANFVGLRDSTSESPVPKAKIRELGELMLWLYGSKQKGTPPRVQSFNPDMERLNIALGSKEGVAALRAGRSLRAAAEIAGSGGDVLRNRLALAKRALQAALEKSAACDGQREEIHTAGVIFDLADDLLATMTKSARDRAAVRRKAA